MSDQVAAENWLICDRAGRTLCRNMDRETAFRMAAAWMDGADGVTGASIVIHGLLRDDPVPRDEGGGGLSIRPIPDGWQMRVDGLGRPRLSRRPDDAAD